MYGQGGDVVLLLLLSCTSSGPDGTASGPGDKTSGGCGPHSSVEEGCPIDPCASECSSVEMGVACCVDAYGRGNFDAYNLERLTTACSGTDCDPDQYLSPQAALCIAQVHGLESGIRWCGSTFEFFGIEATWTNRNTVMYECTDGREWGDVGYDVVQIGARIGEYLTAWEEIGLAECPE